VPSWRAIYRELKRLEMRGDVRRGYFVEGLAGAQFALPEVVERLRLATEDAERAEAPVVVLAASDPANVHGLPADAGMPRDPLGRPRGAGALLVTRVGRVLVAAESRGRRLTIAPDATADEVREAAHALAMHLLAAPSVARRLRDLEVLTIDGDHAATSRWADAFADAGWRRGVKGLRWLGG
jgi:ATP-dependent Lhr-like helicase